MLCACSTPTTNNTTANTYYNNRRQKHRVMKRIYRNDMTPAQKAKLSAANKGKRLSQQTKNRIAQSMQKYWRSLPYKPTSGTTTQGV